MLLDKFYVALAAFIAVASSPLVSALLAPKSSPVLGRHCTTSSWRQRRSLSAASEPRSSREEANIPDGDAHVYLRFSPLIGGPAFLPLHVEVIVALEDANHANQQKLTQHMDTIYFRRTNKLSSTPFLSDSCQLHRFDFLPQNPTDSSTLASLATLQGVPGRVRHRIQERKNIDVSINNMQMKIDSDGEQINANEDGSGITILIPFGSLKCMGENHGGEDLANDLVSTAMKFKDDRSSTMYKELRILWGKNCLSFAIDLLLHVEGTTGVQRISRLNRVDVQ